VSTANLPATRQAQGGDLVSQLKAASGRLEASLPKHFSAEKLIQILSVVVFKTPDLQKCPIESIITAAIQAGGLDLDLNPSLMEAFLIPRWNKHAKRLEAQFQPGYKGLEKLACRTGSVVYIQPREVRSGDVFSISYNPDLQLRHDVAFGPKRGDVVMVYAVARLACGDSLVEHMTVEEVEGVRQKSEMKDFGPWRDHWLEMAKKTVLKRVCKRLPRPSGDPVKAEAFAQLQTAIDADNTQYEAVEGPAEHHAALHDNGTGHGRTGAYASPADVEEYRRWREAYVEHWNSTWLDNWTGPGGLDERVKELFPPASAAFQVSGHLVKWGVVQGLLSAPDDPKQRQKDPFAAVLWVKHRKALKAEAERYARQCWSREFAKLEPPEPDDEAEAVLDAAFPPDAGADG
jgi:recombination protein RecT